MSNFVKGTLFGFLLSASIIVGMFGGWFVGFVVGVLM